MVHRGGPRVAPLFRAAFGKRPPEELYDLHKDPNQLTNVAYRAEYRDTRKDLAERLTRYLESTGDPRALGRPPLWDTHEYFGNKKQSPRKDAPIGKERP